MPGDAAKPRLSEKGAALAKEGQHDFRKWRGKPLWRFRNAGASGVVDESSRQYEACFALIRRPGWQDGAPACSLTSNLHTN
jgi:hypothetical protein